MWMERRNQHHHHETTQATPTGMGQQLAGSGDSASWMPVSAPWHEEDAPRLSPGVTVLPAATAATAEVARACELDALRERFRAACRAASIVPPLHALERWLLLCKWHEPQQDEPLLPALPAPTPADEALAADLGRAGLNAEQASRVSSGMRAEAVRGADTIRQTASAKVAACRVERSSEAADGDVLQLTFIASAGGASTSDDGGDGESDDHNDIGIAGSRLGSPRRSVRVTTACLEKLRELYSRQRRKAGSQGGKAAKSAAAAKAVAKAAREGAGWSAADEADFRLRAFACLLRYHSIGGLGFQAACGSAIFHTLQASHTPPSPALASPLTLRLSSAAALRRQLRGVRIAAQLLLRRLLLRLRGRRRALWLARLLCQLRAAPGQLPGQPAVRLACHRCGGHPHAAAARRGAGKPLNCLLMPIASRWPPDGLAMASRLPAGCLPTIPTECRS